MPIVAAYMVPHPPMIVPEVGRGSERQIEKTIGAYERIAKEIAALKPETIIISSPHATMYADYFHISPGRTASGSFASFHVPQVRFQAEYDDSGSPPWITAPWCRCTLSGSFIPIIDSCGWACPACRWKTIIGWAG